MNANIHINVDEIPPEVAERIGCVFLGYHRCENLLARWTTQIWCGFSKRPSGRMVVRWGFLLTAPT